MNINYVIIFCLICFASCHSEEKQIELSLQDKFTASNEIKKKYGFPVDESFTFDMLTENEKEELKGLDLRREEINFQRMLERYDEPIERLRKVYKEFIATNTDEERKKLIRENCSFFISNCDELEVAFKNSPFLYSEEHKSFIKFYLDGTKGMNVREIMEWGKEVGHNHQIQ